jgi:hypothetical protein
MTIRSFRAGAAGLALALTLGCALPAHAEGAAAGGNEGGGYVTTPSGRVVGPDGSRNFGNRPSYRQDRDFRAERPSFRDDRRDRFERRGSYAYYNGHRGYRDYRRGYREYNGFWFPLAAFAAGALIVGAAPPPVVAVAPNPHVDWCARTYRSYNPYDNTFQPYHGPRAYCISPYS